MRYMLLQYAQDRPEPGTPEGRISTRLDEALELAASCPTAKDGAVEVRPIMEVGTTPR
jgi:hypothetical protein